MKTKKLFAFLLAVVMLSCVSMVSFADSDVTVSAPGSHTFTATIEAITQAPLIEVTIGSDGVNIVANPYHMEWGADSNTDSFINAGAAITNKSNVNLVVSATPTVAKTGPSRVSFFNDPNLVSATGEPQVYMFMQLRTDDNAAPGGTVATTGWATTVGAAGSAGTVAKSEATPATANLKRATATGSNITPSYGAYKFSGVTGGDDWTENDTFSVSIAFSFTPVARFT